jgi:hypothetical protein
MGMEVSFVRHRGRRDRVYVTRSDGTSTAWDFPSYGDRLPHDLCHLVVEQELGIVNGFWGLVDEGVEVMMVDDQATLVRDGRPLVQQVGVDFSDLMAAEEAVALLSPTGIRSEDRSGLMLIDLGAASPDAPHGEDLRAALGFDLPPGTSDEVAASVRHRLDDLAARWRSLDDDEAIVLAWTFQKPG